MGISAKLASKLNHLWRSCTSELSKQNDLFRLTYAMENGEKNALGLPPAEPPASMPWP